MLFVTFYQIRHAISTKQKHNGNIKKQSLGSQFTQAHSFMMPSVTVVQVCRNVQGSQGAGSEMALGPGAQRRLAGLWRFFNSPLVCKRECATMNFNNQFRELRLFR